jgi:hypothetical protein
MTPEQGLSTAAINTWKLNLERANKFFLPLTDEDLQQEIAPAKNRLIYLLGHLTAVHDRMLPLLVLGPRLYPEFDPLFLTNPDKSPASLPSGAEIKKAWQHVNETLQAGFDRLAPGDWLHKHGSVSDEDFEKDPSRNRFSVLLSRTGHIAYHLGQAVLTRK